MSTRDAIVVFTLAHLYCGSISEQINFIAQI